MGKKKLNKHAILEAQRAQSAVGRENFAAVAAAVPGHKTEMKSTFTLSIPTIKKDLVKDFVYATFAVSLLIFLRHSSFGYYQIVSLFTR